MVDRTRVHTESCFTDIDEQNMMTSGRRKPVLPRRRSRTYERLEARAEADDQAFAMRDNTLLRLSGHDIC
jgi:hypothetical protein